MFIYCANIHFSTLKGISRCNMILLDCIKMGGMSFILHKKNADGLRTPHCLFIFSHVVLSGSYTVIVPLGNRTFHQLTPGSLSPHSDFQRRFVTMNYMLFSRIIADI
jgi:hypothetical protein